MDNLDDHGILMSYNLKFFLQNRTICRLWKIVLKFHFSSYYDSYLQQANWAMHQSCGKMGVGDRNGLNLEELSGEIRVIGTTTPNLSKSECKSDGHTVSGNCVVHVSVHGHSSPPLQNIEQSRPWSQAPKGDDHEHDGHSLVTHYVHFFPCCQKRKKKKPQQQQQLPLLLLWSLSPDFISLLTTLAHHRRNRFHENLQHFFHNSNYFIADPSSPVTSSSPT